METREKRLHAAAKPGIKVRGVALIALFLAIGIILRLVSPSVAGITPNWLIAMYCLAIIITGLNIKQAAGVGMVAGVVSMATSKAIFPYASLASEPVGAVICAAVALAAAKLRPGGINLMPGISAFFSTLFSGFTFITLTKFVMSIPAEVYLYAMLPVVLTVAVVNCAIAQALYYPAARLFSAGTALSDSVKED